jgi:hypothetical protein
MGGSSLRLFAGAAGQDVESAGRQDGEDHDSVLMGGRCHGGCVAAQVAICRVSGTDDEWQKARLLPMFEGLHWRVSENRTLGVAQAVPPPRPIMTTKKKKSRAPRRTFTPEFKADAVKLATSPT